MLRDRREPTIENGVIQSNALELALDAPVKEGRFGRTMFCYTYMGSDVGKLFLPVLIENAQRVINDRLYNSLDKTRGTC